MTPRPPRLGPLLAALSLGCGASLEPVAPRDGAVDAPDAAEIFPCNLRVPALAPGADGQWSVWVRPDRFNVPRGCGPADLRDGVARFTAPTRGRWIFQASGAGLMAFTARRVCEDVTSTLACRERAGGPDSFSLALAAGESVILIARGCPGASGTCDWRFDATAAPPTGPSCAGGLPCGAGAVCQRLVDDPAEEPFCVAAVAPEIRGASFEAGLGRARFQVAVEDANRDALDVTVSLLDAAGAPLPEAAAVTGTHALEGGGARRTASSPYVSVGDLGAATQARFVVRDASGLRAERVVPIAPIVPRQAEQSCLDGVPCAPGLCCWYHYNAALCMPDCSR